MAQMNFDRLAEALKCVRCQLCAVRVQLNTELNMSSLDLCSIHLFSIQMPGFTLMSFLIEAVTVIAS